MKTSLKINRSSVMKLAWLMYKGDNFGQAPRPEHQDYKYHRPFSSYLADAWKAEKHELARRMKAEEAYQKELEAKEKMKERIARLDLIAKNQGNGGVRYTKESDSLTEKQAALIQESIDNDAKVHKLVN